MSDGLEFRTPREMALHAAGIAAPVFESGRKVWGGALGIEEYAPTADQLAATLLHLAQSVVENVETWPDGSSASTGGLAVRREVLEGGDTRWSVTLELVSFYENPAGASTQEDHHG